MDHFRFLDNYEDTHRDEDQFRYPEHIRYNLWLMLRKTRLDNMDVQLFGSLHPYMFQQLHPDHL